jgi:hypothetical protein
MKHLYILQNIEKIKFWNIIEKIICWTLNTIKKKKNTFANRGWKAS